MLIAITIELVLQLVLDGDVFLPHMKDVMLQEVFSTVIASILRYACFYFSAQYVQYIPVHQ